MGKEFLEFYTNLKTYYFPFFPRSFLSISEKLGFSVQEGTVVDNAITVIGLPNGKKTHLDNNSVSE